jgi:2'-5' RNA ligase
MSGRPSSQTGAGETFDLTGAERIQVPTLGETRRAAERKTSPRARRAASLVQSVEGGKRRAVELFKQAEDLERRDPNLLATDEGATGRMSRPIFDTATGRPYRRHETLRARAEAELETANRLALDVQRDYADLVEAGFGEDTDPRQLSLRPEQRRRWAYVKPRSGEVRDLLFTRRQGEASDRRTESGLRSLRRAGAPPKAGDLERQRERRDLDVRRAKGDGAAEAELAANLERVEKGTPEEVGTAENVFSRFMRGLTGSGGSALTGASMAPLGDVETAMGFQLAEELAEKARGAPVNIPRPGEPETIAQAALDAERLRDWSEEAFPVDPRVQPSYNPLRKGFWAATLPEAAGSTAPLIAAGALSGPAAPYTSAVLGATQNAGQTYADAKAAGASDEEARAAAGIGALIGTSEAFGLGRILAKLGVARPALQRVAQIVEEYGQEAGAAWANNLNAAIVSGYDPARDTSFFNPEVQGEGLVGALFGVGAQGVGAGAGRLQSLRGARSVRAEQPAPLNLTPTTTGPTELVSLGQAMAKPEFRKRLEEVTKPPAEAAPAESVATPEAAQPAPVPAAGAPVESLTDLLGGAGRAMADNLNVALRESVETSGKLPTAERGSLLNQVFEAAVARGAPRDAATLDKAVQLARQGLEAAKAQFNQAFPAGGATATAPNAQLATAPTDDLTKAMEGLKSLRRPTDAEAKQAAEEAKKQAEQAGKEFEKQAKRASKETEKEAKQAQKEAGKQAKLDEQARRETEGEIRRMRLYDESVNAAQAASEEAEALIESGDYSSAIGKLRAQQNALGQSVKYLPETPEAVRTRANVATIVEGIGQRIPDLRKQALAARQGPAKPEAEPAPAKAAEPAAKRRAETGRRMAAKYREQAQAAASQGRLLEAQAAHKAELQLLNDVMRITPPADVGARAQIRNAITAVENDLRGISGELRKGKSPRAKAVDENAPTVELPAAPLLDEVNNPEGGVPPRTERPSGRFGALVRQQEAEREAAPQSRRKDTGVLSPVEYLKRATDGEGVRVSDRGEAALLGAKEAGIVGLTNRRSRFRLSDAQVMLDEGGFSLDDGRRFTDESVTENDVLDFLGAYGKEARLDTEGLDRRLAEEEAKFYANLPSEPLEVDQGITETAPLSERLTAPESAEARPVEEAPPTRRPTERRFVPKATDQNIEELRDRRDVLSRLRGNRPGELTQDLNDEYRELGSRIAEFEAEQARAARRGRTELAPPPGGDERTFQAPSREDLSRAFAAAEARLEEEAKRAVEALPKSDTELLERGRAAVDALFADIEQDVDALDLLDRAIEGDEDARQGLIQFAERSHGVDADTLGSIIDARRSGREQERGRIRQIAQARRGQSPDQAGAARHGSDRQVVEAGPQARALTGEDLEILNREPGEVADEGFDRFLQSLETLNNDRIRGLVEMPEWATRQLEARIKQANEIRRGRVKEKRLGAKYTPQSAKAQPLSKTEGGRRLVEQAKKKESESKADEAPTVVHPNPEIDRKPILAETNRGTVIVPNPANKTGVSEVKDRSAAPAEHKFSSTQVNLPKEIADKIFAFGRRIPDKDLADNGRETEPHITIKYGLHGWDSKFVEEALAGEGPVTVKFGKVSLFENDDFDVVKVDVESPGLHRLNKKIAESQPNTETFPDYKPHITIAYVKKGKGKRYVGKGRLEGKTVTLSSVTFSGRDGERVEIPLAGKPKSTGAIPAEAMPELRAPGAPPSPLAAKGKEAPSGKRQSYAIPDEAMLELREKAKQSSGGTYLGAGPGALQPLLDRGASVLARRTKVPIPESFDVNEYIDDVIEALGKAQKRGVSPKAAAGLPGEIEKLVEAVADNDGWAVVDAHKQINKIIGSRRKSEEIGKIDAGVLAKLSTLRKAGFLARIPTHLRNIFGNTLFQQMEEVSRMPAAMMDTLISLGNKRRTVAGPSATAVGRAIGKAATTGLKEAGQVMKKGLTDAEAKEQQLQEVRFRNPVLDSYARYVFRSLSASDAVFFRGAYDRALSERARLQAMSEAREGLIKRDQVKAREKEIRENPDLDIDLAAKEDARIAVFRNENAISKRVTALRGTFGSGGNFAVDMVLPFDRTPSNIFVKTLEYTPLGYGRNVIQAGRALMNREFTPEQQRAFAQTFGRATTGTFGVMLLGYVLAARGMMTGFYDEEDKDREALRRAAGRMPASVRIGDRWYSVGGLAPLGTLLALGATVHRETHEEVKDEEDRPLRSLKASSKFVFDLPLMRGTKDIVDAASQPGSLGQRLGRIGASFIPAPVADVGTLADDSQRDTASSLRGFRKVGSEFANEIRARLLVARISLPPKVDVFGEPVRTEKSDVIDPFASRPAEESVRGLQDLLDLDLGLSKPQREKGETGEEFNARVRERGQLYKGTLAGLSDDKNVRGMSRETRRAVYEKSLDPQAMERAGKLSDGSVRIERQIEGLRGDAFAALRSIPEYEKLSAKDQKAVRELINKELDRHRAEAAHLRKGEYGKVKVAEKRARVPDWTPAELAKAAVEARR